MTQLVKCAGCGKDKLRGLASYDTNEVVDVEIAIGQTVPVCVGRGRDGASDDCVRKARFRKCPGCGGEISYQLNIHNPVMCATCKADFARGKLARTDESAGVQKKWSLLQGGGTLLGVYLEMDTHDVARKIAQVIARVAGGRMESDRLKGEEWERHGYVPPPRGAFDLPYAAVAVETTPAQHEALLELQKLLADVFDRAKRAGFKDGEDLLGKLTRGEKSIAEFDDQATKRRPKREEKE